MSQVMVQRLISLEKGLLTRLQRFCPAMMLRYSLNEPASADRIESAVQRVLSQGYRTADIYEEGTQRVGTAAMGDAVLKALN